MIGIDDRISDVLERDERLVDVLAAFSPHFAKLRNPGLRRVMGRLVTVRQAAGIAGVQPEALLAALNGEAVAADGPPAADSHEPTAPVALDPASASAAPAGPSPDAVGGGDPAAEFLSRLDPATIVDLDVREDLRAGREPFARIMAAVGALPDGAVLRLRAIFEPVPLYGVLEKRGLSHRTECHARDDWSVWFFPRTSSEEVALSRPSGADAARSAAIPQPGSGTRAGGGHERPPVLRLDVRGLEPPEPMVRTLAALEDLPPGGVLVQTNVRVPRFLIEELDRRGFRHEVRVLSDDEVEVTIARTN